MTATSSTGSSAPVAQVLSDERALERIFRAQFDSLAAEARTHLEDAAGSAAKVVEGAFRSAWEDRQHFNKQEELDAYLVDAVKHGSARERARRASARGLGGHTNTGTHATQGATVTAEQAWQHLQHALHPDSTGGGANRAEALKHETAAHMKGMGKKNSWVMPALIAVVALGIALVGVWYFDAIGEQAAIAGALAAPDAKSFNSPSGQLANVTLNDGTKVSLTPESKLTVAKDFSGKAMRAVRLDGGATFEVAPGQEKQFQVRAGKAAIFATGTVFTVYAYGVDSTITVAVKEGSVKLEQPMGTKDAHEIAAGKALFVDQKGTVRSPDASELAEATSWTNQRVTLTNRQLRNAIAMFKRWYGMTVLVPDLPLLDRPVTLDAPLDSSRAAISQVEQTASVKFGWEDQSMVFRDAKKK